ncbi:MAG: CCA tRNA nucleotidyltransferase [Ruminococcus sp.]|nr:CCA tRNA nucleotidyltransferase [Ruminococcus sp.]
MKRAGELLKKLNKAGFEAYYVGGCVRDMLMNRTPHDIDITTNALPEEIMDVFSDFHVTPTGIKHGTVTVMHSGIPYEITTYRIDGEYTDMRRPDSVRFTSSLEEDLIRRDFTMNAIAMNYEGGITDPFGGARDIENGIIRCAGEPEKRFTEDALRILRCVRFASKLGFDVEPMTAEAVHRLKGGLDFVARERVREELDGIICGEACVQAMLEFSDVIVQIIPEFQPCIGFQQHSPYHCYDVWEHTVRAVSGAPCTSPLLRRTMLFHDIGKPQCFSRDEKGVGHFKGHAKISAALAEDIMQRLRYDNSSIRDVSQLISAHNDRITSEKQIRRMLSRMGEELFFDLLDVKKADNSAKRDFVVKETEEFDEIARTARRILSENACMKLSQLAVNGNDMISLGFKGREIGQILNRLLELAVDGEIANEREVMLEFAESEMKNR